MCGFGCGGWRVEDVYVKGEDACFDVLNEGVITWIIGWGIVVICEVG